MRQRPIRAVLFLFSLTAGLTACATGEGLARAPATAPRHHAGATLQHDMAGADTAPTRAVSLKEVPELKDIIPRLAASRVVYVGETHDRLEQHQTQLAIIRGLHALHPDLVVGMEYFQQPFQKALDDYVAGRIEEAQMLRRTEYFDRWGYDYRLYRPILRYARGQGIPLIALNLPAELTRKVHRAGMGGLSAAERAQLPKDMDRSDERYIERLREVYKMHPGSGTTEDFQRFYDAQLLWDEGMAARAAKYLRAHPGTHMVVLTGTGHVIYGTGIPQRLQRRLPVSASIVLMGLGDVPSPEMGDYWLLPEPQSLQSAGHIGVMLDPHAKQGGMLVQGVEDRSGAAAADIQTGDRITRIAGQSVHSMTDVRLALLDRAPGDQVAVDVLRKAWWWRTLPLTLKVTLQ